MTASKLRAGDILAGAGGLALLVVMFLPWYHFLPGPYEGSRFVADNDTAQSAWEAFSVLLVPLVLTALLGLTLFAATLFERTSAVPVAAQVFGAAIGSLTVLFVFIRVVDPPGPNFAATVQWAAWAGLAATVAIAAGAWWSMRDEFRP
jgi:threonine/homoserine/homoserine lactone efflux protein